jgi:hypothetical protein
LIEEVVNMAVRVSLQRGMNHIGPKTYEQATTFKRDSQGYLTVLKGTKKIAEHAAYTWESVEIIDMLDTVPQGREVKVTSKSKSGDRIRTSPRRSNGKARKPKARRPEAPEWTI